MNKKQNCNDKECVKLESYALDLVAYTMKMQAVITKKVEEARTYEMKACEIRKKAEVLETQGNALIKEVEELNKQLETQLKKANMLMLKTIECYKENGNEEVENNCNCNNNCSCNCNYNCNCNEQEHCDYKEECINNQYYNNYRNGYGYEQNDCNQNQRRDFGYNNMQYGNGQMPNYNREGYEENNRYWHN